MTFLYIWSGFAGLLCVLFVLKLLLQIGLELLTKSLLRPLLLW